MTIDELKDHSDERDDIVEKKLDKIDDFLHNGLSEKIIKGIMDYLNEQTAKRVRLFFRIAISAIIVGIISGAIKIFYWG